MLFPMHACRVPWSVVAIERCVGECAWSCVLRATEPMEGDSQAESPRTTTQTHFVHGGEHTRKSDIIILHIIMLSLRIILTACFESP